jgi:beta-lactam-binding protein with PASTA domain
MIPAAMRERVPPQPQTQPGISNANSTVIAAATVPSPTSGTVVLDVEQGGITVPSFSGKSVRSAIELAESSGLDLDVVGSGLGQEQNPPAGAHVLSGARITVKFGR